MLSADRGMQTVPQGEAVCLSSLLQAEGAEPGQAWSAGRAGAAEHGEEMALGPLVSIH